MDRADNLRRIKEQASLPKQPKIRKQIAKVSEKKKKQLKEEKAINKSKGGSELSRWFDSRRLEMTGKCDHCQGKTSKDSDKYFAFCIAHILPKNIFKSVKAHPLNWVELCFFQNSCHTNFDTHAIDITELNCYDVVIERFIAMYPDIDPKERKYIPDVLMQYVKNETDI